MTSKSRNPVPAGFLVGPFWREGGPASRPLPHLAKLERAPAACRRGEKGTISPSAQAREAGNVVRRETR